MSEGLAGTANKKRDSGAGKPAELAKKPKAGARRPRRYIAPQKGRDWYEKAEDQIAIISSNTDND